MSEENGKTMVEPTPDTPSLKPKSINDLKHKMKLTGVVKRLELYGAFIDVGVGVNALIHISQLSQKRVNRVADVLNVGDEVVVWVDKVDPQRQQITVTMVEPLAVEWSELRTGQVYTGNVSRLENFGAFINVGAEREGLVHISELSHGFVKHPGEVLKVGDEVQVQVLGFSKRKRRIDLSIKALMDKPEPVATAAVAYQKSRVEPVYEDDEDEMLPTAMEIAMRKAMGDRIPAHRRKKGRGRRRRRRVRAQQEDILSRTLQLQQEA